MVYLNEWLPNPVGNDTQGEFVELFNNAGRAASLNGYTLATDKKKISLAGYSIPPDGYLMLKTSVTKLALKNTDGGLWLYGPNGAVLDHGAFAGSAQEGRSFGRVVYGDGHDDYDKHANIQVFAWGNPTPGAKNKAINNTIAVQHYPLHTPLNRPLGGVHLFELTLGTAAMLAGLFIYIVQTNEDLSKLFFGRDETIGP